MKFKTLSTMTNLIAFGIMLSGRVWTGFAFAMVGILISLLLSNDMEPVSGCSGSTPKEKEPYYKDDFEKYQHYKISNKK